MDDQSWQEVYDFTSSSASKIPTPTGTLSTISEPISAINLKDDQDLRPIDLTLAFQNPPIEGRKFLIRTREEPHRILTVCNGNVRCLLQPIPGGGSIWHCHKKFGWLGLRNTVSGTYLGHDNDGTICAKRASHWINEYLTVDRDESGGQILHVLVKSTTTMGIERIERMQVCLSEDGKSLVPRKEGGAVWDFIDLKYYQQSSSLVYPGMKPEKLR
ncbi:hypothetical protein M431DRAFT_505941 [Trichoderma harzianum CBS 226.95]|uniref:Uncharacterized protein n=1 Tax=Trichoderma harzianum CBS 226.95 TaxID=983964 RepID=A0A2T4AMY5_TRIHA|nr:hypothetical protein M431DRAFT_505941 [Trichoderma harzianum CBS 226.95]PTB58441.1 hypothetical protein M431DRAFT_505941 [Trichoderma harzianum CBS 226.95]